MTIQEYFAGDLAGGADFLELERRGAQTVLCEENAVILYMPPDGTVLFAAKNEDAARKAARLLPRTGIASVHGEVCAQIAAEALGLKGGARCYQARYLLPELPEMTAGIEVRILDEQYIETAARHYKGVGEDSGAYMRERVKAGALLGAFFLNGILAGFIGTHHEGSMGMLEIFPEYRRLGLGYALESALIRRLMEQGAIPYCQVYEGNEASLRLQRKLGLTFSDEFVYWLS